MVLLLPMVILTMIFNVLESTANDKSIDDLVEKFEEQHEELLNKINPTESDLEFIDFFEGLHQEGKEELAIAAKRFAEEFTTIVKENNTVELNTIFEEEVDSEGVGYFGNDYSPLADDLTPLAGGTERVDHNYAYTYAGLRMTHLRVSVTVDYWQNDILATRNARHIVVNNYNPFLTINASGDTYHTVSVSTGVASGYFSIWFEGLGSSVTTELRVNAHNGNVTHRGWFQ